MESERSSALDRPADRPAEEPNPAPRVRDPLEAARVLFEAAQAQEGRLTFLSRASMALGTSLDSTATLRNVARLAVPELADICLIDLSSGLHTPRRVAAASRDPEHERRLQNLLGSVILPEGGPQEVALRTSQAQIGVADPETGVPWLGDRRLFEDFGVAAYLILPLRSRGQTLGIVTLLSTRQRAYAADVFATAGEFVARSAVALDNALLYESALRARAAAEAAQQQFQHLVTGLRESEARYRALFEETRDAIYITRRDGQFVDANTAALQLFRCTRAELLRMNALELYWAPEDRDRFSTTLEGSGSVRDYELALRRRDGERLDCLLSSHVRRSQSGEILGYQGIIRDITERKRAERKLMESEHFTRTIISSVRQGVIVYDRALRHQVWNRFMEDLTGLGADSVISRPALESLPQLRDHGAETLLQRALAGETVQSPDMPFSIPQTGRSGWISTVYGPHVSPDGEVIGVVAIVHDIAERKLAEDRLLHNAFHDALTGLPNRALFLDRLERLVRHTERHKDFTFGVAFLDLDRFKLVNDSLGHMVGDELLVQIARRLEQCVRAGDTVARLGGDEFAVLLDDLHDPRDPTRVAERILSELGTSFHLADQDVFVSASIGIALSSTGYDRAEDLLRDADAAMYRAKVEGRSRVEVFDRNIHERAVHTLQAETDLRRALERGEFLLHYQPIIRLGDGHITGFEALIRWEHPRRGRIPPDEFIPLAEETGSIVAIGQWVLEVACTQLRTWMDRFPERHDLTISVNLSPRQLREPALLQQIDDVLARTGLPAGNLKLEITENVIVEHEETVRATLTQLRERGIRLCIDDFGTGYSSLSYLHAFPFDTLKIDRSFVAQIGISGSNSRLVETIVALSHNLGMAAVAEGVETPEQLRLLRELGPEFAQGFLFSAARPAADIDELLERRPSW